MNIRYLYAAMVCIFLNERDTMLFIARRSLFLTVLQLVAIASYYASLRLVRNKQQRTLNTIQLRFLG
jgi:predicted acyltransferase